MSAQAAFWIPLLPLLGFVFAGALGKRLGKAAVSVVCCGVMALAFVLSCGLFLNRAAFAAQESADGMPKLAGEVVVAWEWLSAGDLAVDLAFLVDPLSLVMLLVVTGVGTLIHVYSMGYMHDDDGYHRYFAYLNLFCFFMLVLVLAESLPVMFVGWEGVGLCSYLLIGFWYRKKSASDAGLKAFLVNRVGDWGFLVAMVTAFLMFGTLSFPAMVENAPSVHHQFGPTLWTLMTFMLFVAAIGKSAQIPLYVWLPDAMEGPTPVSALIHAATMVTSGIYMIARLFPLFLLEPDVLIWVALIGSVTAAFAATMGLVATDIKKVLAYSTISQLGYMFLGLGVGAAAAGMFHLVTHAFFKACLFLGAGAVMHAMGNETDIRKMGGLRHKIPWTFWTMAVATAAIAGVPFLSGFVSKDAILWNASHPPYAHAAHQPLASAFGGDVRLTLALLFGLVTVALTAFYMGRLLFLTFFGKPRDQRLHDHAHEAGPSMKWVLVVLAAAAAVAGVFNWPAGLHGHETFSHFLEPVVRPEMHPHLQLEAHHPHWSWAEVGFSLFCLAVATLGGFLAWRWYSRESDQPRRWAERFPQVYKLFDRKWYVDEVYGFAVVGAVVRGSRFLREWIDEVVVNGTVEMIGLVTEGVGELLRGTQTGQLRNYALFLALGAGVVLVWVVW